MTEQSTSTPKTAAATIAVKTAKPEKPIRLASGRIAKLQKGQVPTTAHFNALLDDLAALEKRVGRFEKVPPKAAVLSTK